MKKLMEQMNREKILGLINAAILSALLSACASGGNDTPVANLNPVSTIGTGTTGTGTTGPTSTTSTNTATLKVNTGALNAMFFKSGATNPTNVQMTMSVYNSGAGYAGNVTISYTDTNGSHATTLSTTHPSYTSTSNAEYNVWLNATQWHGFFQDLYGAIVVVIDHSTSTGDGSVGNLGGSVYFQNFGKSGVQGPLRMCWQIDPVGGASTTPYDCRTFLTSFADGAMPVTTSSLYPNNQGQGRPAYAQLGTFEGLSQTAAFGN